MGAGSQVVVHGCNAELIQTISSNNTQKNQNRQVPKTLIKLLGPQVSISICEDSLGVAL